MASFQRRNVVGRGARSYQQVDTKDNEEVEVQNEEDDDIITKKCLLSSSSSEKDGDGKNNSISNNNKNSNVTATMRRLIDMALPERYLMIFSGFTMVLSTTVSLAVPAYSGKIIDLSIGTTTDDNEQRQSSSLVVLIQLLCIMTLSGFLGYFRIVWQAKVGHSLIARIRRKLYSKMLSQDTIFFDSMNHGDIISRLSSDADLIQAAITDHILGLLRNTIIATGSMFLLFYTSIALAFISVITLPPIGIAGRYVGRQMKGRQQHIRELHGTATSYAEQALTCIRTVQQFVMEDYESKQYNNAINNAHANEIQTATLQALFRSIMGMVINLALLCVLGYGGRLISNGQLSPGDLASFVMYSVMMGTNISGISTQYMDLMKSLAAASRVFEIIDRVPIIPSPNLKDGEVDTTAESSDSLVLLSSSTSWASSWRMITTSDHTDMGSKIVINDHDSTIEMMEFGMESGNDDNHDVSSATSTTSNTTASTSSGIHEIGTTITPMSIHFDNVTFSYPTRPESNILNGLNFSIQAGQVVALVGGSGAGKSTIASLVTRLYDPQLGQITMNDNSIILKQTSPHIIRRNVGIVEQEPLLFSTTIEANIRYGCPKATKDEVYYAAKLAFVMEFVTKFPEGLNTLVGPRGTQLSGGQKQRVAVARCILKNPPIMIFDEATSALDAESESQVQKAIDIACKGRTVIMIAHRLSTIRNVDVIAVLQDGKIAETGTFDELLSKSDDSSPFRQLMKKQLLVQ